MGKLDRLVDQARPHLEPGEQIVAAVMGTYETKIMGSDSIRTGTLIATDRRIVFYAKKLGGYDLESFPYGNVSSFEQGKNLMGHNLRFFASGNKVEMKWIKSDTHLARFTDTVKAGMAARHGGAAAAPATAHTPPPAPPAGPQPDVMEQLRKLGELRDAGILTQEEFDAKKTQLLARV